MPCSVLAGRQPLASYLKLSRDPQAARLPKPAPAPASAALAFARNRRLGRGLNLAGVLDGTQVQPMDPGYFKTIRAAGFTNLRLPIRWAAHCAKEAPYTINPAFFGQVDQVVR